LEKDIPTTPREEKERYCFQKIVPCEIKITKPMEEKSSKLEDLFCPCPLGNSSVGSDSEIRMKMTLL
jgi:hypothetical protein